MSVERDQLAQKLIDAHHLDKQIESNGVLKAFKDGVTDAMIHGTKDEMYLYKQQKQTNYYYKQGYDFGIDLFCKQEEWTHE